ncbi:hypothetical protein BpHYR1_022631 [Brachionus plicatilis]|uniref:Uncharacterized protein n=1 Tax=Brachionus plicatilis TaxID=10195 RepID=A0A3M7Q6E9_BRAPC|nr:hypothetical protein BpHYR1_022631 [Brachionus plicatilis]
MDAEHVAITLDCWTSLQGKLSQTSKDQFIGSNIETVNEINEEDHHLDLILPSQEIKILESFRNLIVKCRKTAAAFHQSTILTEITLWNSTFIMMERFWNNSS